MENQLAFSKKLLSQLEGMNSKLKRMDGKVDMLIKAMEELARIVENKGQECTETSSPTNPPPPPEIPVTETISPRVNVTNLEARNPIPNFSNMETEFYENVQVDFPKFNGESPKNSIRLCQSYSAFHPMLEHEKVLFASMHLEEIDEKQQGKSESSFSESTDEKNHLTESFDVERGDVNVLCSRGVNISDSKVWNPGIEAIVSVISEEKIARNEAVDNDARGVLYHSMEDMIDGETKCPVLFLINSRSCDQLGVDTLGGDILISYCSILNEKHGLGLQECIAFSIDGTRFATGGLSVVVIEGNGGKHGNGTASLIPLDMEIKLWKLPYPSPKPPPLLSQEEFHYSASTSIHTEGVHRILTRHLSELRLLLSLEESHGCNTKQIQVWKMGERNCVDVLLQPLISLNLGNMGSWGDNYQNLHKFKIDNCKSDLVAQLVFAERFFRLTSLNNEAEITALGVGRDSTQLREHGSNMVHETYQAIDRAREFNGTKILDGVVVIRVECKLLTGAFEKECLIEGASLEIVQSLIELVKSNELKEFRPYGFAIYPTRIVRADRLIVEELCADRQIHFVGPSATLAVITTKGLRPPPEPPPIYRAHMLDQYCAILLQVLRSRLFEGEGYVTNMIYCSKLKSEAGHGTTSFDENGFSFMKQCYQLMFL